MLAELGQGLRSVLVEAGEHGQRRVSEAAFGALAAKAPVEAPDGGAQLPAEVGLLSRGGLLPGCTLLAATCTRGPDPQRKGTDREG